MDLMNNIVFMRCVWKLPVLFNCEFPYTCCENVYVLIQLKEICSNLIEGRKPSEIF